MPCPICSKPENAAYRPFCSRRCADVDLARWLNGRYAVPTEESPEEGEAASGTAGRDPAEPDVAPRRGPRRPH